MLKSVKFIEFYARQIFLRRVFLITTLFFFITTLIFGFLWFFSPLPKTKMDMAKEYIYQRYNFSPSSVKKAYFNPLQYQTLVYGQVISHEIDYIAKENIYSLFILHNIYEEKPNVFSFSGERILFSVKENKPVEIISTGIIQKVIEYKNGKFAEP